MRVSTRQRQIIQLLLLRRDGITAGEIAEEIKVSTRTVHRELDELEAVLAEYGVELLKKAGKGLLLQAPGEELEALHRRLFEAVPEDYTAEDRKALILCMLLQAEEPVKLFALAHSLKVTVPTVTNDLDELEGWLARSGLTLVRRRGYGVELTGEEDGLRSMLSLLAMQHLDEADLFGRPEDLAREPVKRRLLELIGRPHLKAAEDALWAADRLWLKLLAEHEYARLLIRMSVMLGRIREGRQIREVQQEQQLPEHLLKLAEELSPALGGLPPEEVRYLAGLLQLADTPDRHGLVPEANPGSMDLAKRLVSVLEAELQAGFGEDRQLLEGLTSHLESALPRIREGFQIRNPLLSQIRRDYDRLFVQIREAADTVLPGLPIPDEEIGFLVMHFGASLERLKSLRRSVRAVIVCTSGIGSSKMLAIRLNKELPQVEIITHASWYEAVRIPEEEYDLIISTVDLPLEEHRYIKLSPLLTTEESERLRRFIREVTLQRGPGRGGVGSPPAESLERLHRLQAYLNEIVSIVDQFQVHGPLEAHGGLRGILEEACGRVRQRAEITDLPAVVELLLERQKMSSQVIPDTGIALFHTRSGQIGTPSFTLFTLREELPLESGEGAGVKHLLLMLGPRELSKESLEVLSEISSFLLDAEFVELLKQGSEEEIRLELSTKLTEFFESIYKTDKRRIIR
ncbi:BglG family transcription antiterminator [Paenibacillus mucilaginosus]|uniref:PRD domain-containing protein n=1 Tax=Paenibacillus mucilaginosus (strain KNP414) TaxID=1036673 RepID=F8FNC3_PAEMK|nr:BglG family transcription antiterminator [Paenibacillus mucilaginosus]AEI38960.1 PRD domain-containing protein [Paenibacillus mucilaginosus KNP414]MCG7216581.1 BglG family transcription antiterminator [Paenibacillus mucilaginosus]WDM28005.1 transcription antiterminator [Paenibacillus mucilaginosus]